MEDGVESEIRAATGPNRQRTYALLCALGWFVISLAVFSPSFAFDWMRFDDEVHILQNEQLRLGFSPAGIHWAFTTGFAANWFPLTWLSWMADYEFFEFDAGPFHRTNVVLHALSAAILSFAMWRLTRSVWRSAFVAGVFALHPLHVESVAWISERKGLLSGLFFMLALLAYAEYARQPSRSGRYLLVCAAMALGLMAKPVLVTLPFVLLLLDIWPLHRMQPLGSDAGTKWIDTARLRDCVREKLPLFGLSVLSSYVTFQVQRAGGAVASTSAVPPLDRIKGALVGYAGYLEETFWPNEMALFYPIREIAWTQASLAGLLLVGITTGAWLTRRQRPYLLVGWLWFLGMLVPTIGLIQVGAQAGADRYTYLPMIGLAMALAWGVVDILPRGQASRAAASALAVGLLAAFGCATAVQLAYWKDSMTLMRHTLAVTGDNPGIERKLAEGLSHLGQMEEATAMLDHALSLAPNDPMIHITIGGLELAQGHEAKAAHAYLRALELDPNQPLAHQMLGEIRMDQRRYEEACSLFEMGVRASGGSVVELQFELGICLVEAGRLDQAVPWLEHAAGQAQARNTPTDYATPYLKLAAAARAGTPASLRGSDLRTPGLLRGKAELLVRANRPQAAIRELQTALRLTEMLDYPQPIRDAVQNRIDELDRDSGFFTPGGAGGG